MDQELEFCEHRLAEKGPADIFDFLIDKKDFFIGSYSVQ